MSRIKIPRKEVILRLNAGEYGRVPSYLVRALVGSTWWSDMTCEAVLDEEPPELVTSVAAYCDYFFEKYGYTVFPETGKRHRQW